MIGRFISADTIVQDFSNPQTLNRYTYCLNNPLVYIDPTGYFSFSRLFESFVSGFAGGVAFVLSGGNLAVAGMVAGAVSGAFTGELENVLKGAVTGGILGGAGGIAIQEFGNIAAYGLLAAGAGYAGATEGLDGLAYFAGGFAGGIAGAVGASDIMASSLSPGQTLQDDPLHYDGKKLTATDGKGEVIGSWDATSGKRGSTTKLVDQARRDFGPIPANGNYSVDPSQIQRWSDLPLSQKVAAYLPGKHGQWPDGVPAWGHTRVPIQIHGLPAGINRSGFFIHGGWSPGSAGCIDLGSNESSFFNYLSGQNETIPLTVKY